MPSRRYRTDKVSRRTAPSRRLAVILNGELCGWLGDHGDNIMSFTYDEGYAGVDLSVALPCTPDVAVYGDTAVRPYIEGLLPDGEPVRAAMAEKRGLRRNDLFGLLAEYGRDCPGAVQICTEGEIEAVMRGEGGYEPVTAKEIAARLNEAARGLRPNWHGNGESWSLGGNQGKVALAKIDGQWMRCLGAYPSTHILKPGVAGMSCQALVEFVTMKAASECGMAVPEVQYSAFAGEPAIIVERYDRAIVNGSVYRLHQEDFSQALGYLPVDKYEITTGQMAAAIRSYADVPSLRRFTEALFFNYLVGGTDAHAKNYSLLHVGGSATTLAPFYDMASVLPYERKEGAGKWRRIPMSIGGVRKVGALVGTDIVRHAELYGLEAAWCLETMRRLAEEVPAAIDGIGSRFGHIDGMRRVAREMSRPIAANCTAVIANLHNSRRPEEFTRPNLSMINGGSLKWEAETPAQELPPKPVASPTVNQVPAHAPLSPSATRR